MIRKGNMSPMQTNHFILKTEYIKLDQLLKALGIVNTGGEAKVLIEAGKVGVNEEIERHRGRKVKPGDRVAVVDTMYFIQ
jgi:ribosome-associated protein